MIKLQDMLGKTMDSVEVQNEALIFTASDGKRYGLHHEQDCCETVAIESIVGDLTDLIGAPLLLAEESTSNTHPKGYVAGRYEESFTWTFYKFATHKGYVDVRWLGESNGYYSESVTFAEICDAPPKNSIREAA